MDLTPLQIEILVMVANGLSGKECAQLLKHTESTIESYRGRMIKQCGCRNSAQLVTWGFKNKYLI